MANPSPIDLDAMWAAQNDGRFPSKNPGQGGAQVQPDNMQAPGMIRGFSSAESAQAMKSNLEASHRQIANNTRDQGIARGIGSTLQGGGVDGIINRLRGGKHPNSNTYGVVDQYINKVRNRNPLAADRNNQHVINYQNEVKGLIR